MLARLKVNVPRRNLIREQTSSGLRGSSGAVLDLDYEDDFLPVYTTPAYFGQKGNMGGNDSKFVIDTTTPYITVTDKGCDNCYEDKDEGVFDVDESRTFQYITRPEEPEQIEIGESVLSGYWGKDKIYLLAEEDEEDGKEKRLQVNAEFFLITHIVSGQDRTNLDGQIGLGIPSSVNSYSPTKSLVEVLYGAG